MQKFKNVHREDPEKNVSETDRQADRLTDRQTDEQNYKYSKIIHSICSIYPIICEIHLL